MEEISIEGSSHYTIFQNPNFYNETWKATAYL